ncbi:MAG: hypothetical protein FJ263_08345 [Planctomycetes bacterium]|nr:hypothetical protein [Planctomycetota bacterium]
MKKVMIGTAMVVMLTCAVVVWAANEEQAAKEKKALETPRQVPNRISGTPMRDQMRGRGPGMPGPGGMQQAYEEFTKKREEEHKKAVAELEEIRKIAESEKATKTVEALQKMIDKKNADFKKATEESENKRAEMQQRMDQLQKERAAKNAQNPAVKPEGEPKEKAPVKKTDK